MKYLSNYATRAEFKKATGVDTSNVAKRVDLPHLKSFLDKLDIDQLKNVPTNFSSLKSKGDKLDVDKLVPVPVDLSKLIKVVKNDVVNKIQDKITDITNLGSNNTPIAKTNMVKNKIPNITHSATTTAITAVENKKPDNGNLVKKKMTIIQK